MIHAFLVSYSINFLLKFKISYLALSNLLDSEQDCLRYEALGDWSELVRNQNGDVMYRQWNFYDRSTNQEIYIQFPKNWEAYFARPIMYPRTKLGKLFKI